MNSGKGFTLPEMFPASHPGIKNCIALHLHRQEMESTAMHTGKFISGKNIHAIDYRPMDIRYCLMDDSSPDIASFIKHTHSKFNFYLNVASPGRKKNNYTYGFLTRNPTPLSFLSASQNVSIYPLYVYPQTEPAHPDVKTAKMNLDRLTLKQMSSRLALTFVDEKQAPGNVCMASSPDVRPEYKITFNPLDVLDYIYAILFLTPYYRKQTDHLKKGLQVIPYIEDNMIFWRLVSVGAALRKAHLFEIHDKHESMPGFPVMGDNKITCSFNNESLNKEGLTHSKVWINDSQYFENVPSDAWKFYIGEYQPAQQWLNERQGKILHKEDVIQFQKLTAALTETCRLIQNNYRQILEHLQ